MMIAKLIARLINKNVANNIFSNENLNSILSLFSAGEQGAWYDPSDFSTMFQDAAGTTPVTAVGQPVGLILDKSGRGNHATQTTTISRPVLQQDASGRYYLRFDGVDDWLVTPSIDFTSTDKMTVFAGFRKLASVTQSIVANKDLDAAGPIFGLWADSGSTNVVRAFSGGAVINGGLTSITATGLPAPLTLVSTFTGDIAADINRLRINGVLAAETFSNQGSGNHANLPLFIGTNPIGTSRRFNGYIYSLIVRGAQSSEAQILSAETYCNQKTGAY